MKWPSWFKRKEKPIEKQLVDIDNLDFLIDWIKACEKRKNLGVWVNHSREWVEFMDLDNYQYSQIGVDGYEVLCSCNFGNYLVFNPNRTDAFRWEEVKGDEDAV